jgi:hypothetical protein
MRIAAKAEVALEAAARRRGLLLEVRALRVRNREPAGRPRNVLPNPLRLLSRGEGYSIRSGTLTYSLFGEDLRPRALVVGDPNYVGLLKFVLDIKLRAARVVDMPAVSVQRHRNVFSNVPDAMYVLRITAGGVTNGHLLFTTALQVGIAGLTTVIARS